MRDFREFRGPVTNLTSLEGYIILTIGNRLETHQWTGSTLMRTAFFDAPILISSLNVVKTFILFGDVHKGIYFVQYRDQVSCNALSLCLFFFYVRSDLLAGSSIVISLSLVTLLPTGKLVHANWLSCFLRVPSIQALHMNIWPWSAMILKR